MKRHVALAVLAAAIVSCAGEEPPDCERYCTEAFPLFVAGRLCEDDATCSCMLHPGMYGGQWTACMKPGP